MRNLLLARKILALAVCLALPSSAFSAELSRVSAGGPVAIFAPAAPQFHQELVLRLDAMIPMNAPLDAALTPDALRRLAALNSAQAAPAQSPALQQANAFIARVLLLSPEAAREELARAHVEGAAAERLLAASTAMQVRVLTDPGTRAAYLELSKPRKAVKPGVVDKARALAARLQLSFRPAAPVLAGGPDGVNPDLSADGRTLSEGTYAAETTPLLKSGLVPVAKRVSELRRLAQNDPEAAFALAEKILSDSSEPRLEVRVSALRVLQTYPAERIAPLFIKLAADPSNWYIQRQAAQSLGGSAANLGAQAEPAVAALKTAFKSSNPSVRLMAKWSLEKLGVDPGPEKKPVVIQIIGSVPGPRGFLRDGPAEQAPKKGPSFFKMIAIGMMLFLVFKIFTAQPPAAPAKPAAAPAQVEQTIAAPKLPEAKTPEQQVMNQMAVDMHQMAETAKRAQAQAERLETERKAKEAAAEASKGSPMMGILIQIAFAILPIFLLVWLFKRMQGGAAGNIAKSMSGGKMNMEKPDTRFSDVAGVDDALIQIQQVADYIRNPQRYTRLGAKAPKGVLLEGPPGTGKTLMARALAGESGANFISMKGSDFIELFVGVGAGRVRELFETARKAAPTILFIDEIDAIGKARGQANVGGGGSSEHEQTLISLIAELDGFTKMDNVIVIAATNRADTLDPALLRPGRFDRKIYVGTPDVLGREAILAVHGAKYRLSPDVDLEFTARRTAGLAGAGMANILNEGATQGAMEDHDAVMMDDVQRGVDKETMGERRNLYIDDATKERVAYHEAGHALAGMLAKESGGKAPNKITIIPHGSAALGYAEPASEGEADTYLLTKDQIFARIVGAMGGRAAEEVTYGKDNPDKGISTGPGSDIEDHADRLARVMVEKLGMSERVGIIDAGRDKNHPLGGYKVGEKTREMVDDEVRKTTGEALKKAKELLLANQDKLEAMVKILKERETIYQQEIEDIVHPKKK